MRLLRLFLALIFAFSLVFSMAHAKQPKKAGAKSTKAAIAKSKPAAKGNATYKLKPAKARVRSFFNAAYYELREMGYSTSQALNAAFVVSIHCWRESNMYGAGVAKWLYENHHAINPAHITVPTEWKGIWKREWDNGVSVRKKWAGWETYGDAARGTIEYIQRNNSRAFKAALRGDINGYADAVSNSNYHNGNAQDYRKVLVDCAPTVKRMLEKAKE